MRIILDSRYEMAKGIWSVMVDPLDARLLNGDPFEGGTTVILAAEVELDDDDATLIVDARHSRAVSIGWDRRALVVLTPYGPPADLNNFIKRQFRDRSAEMVNLHSPDRETEMLARRSSDQETQGRRASRESPWQRHLQKRK